jgi:hypothetical protein
MIDEFLINLATTGKKLERLTGLRFDRGSPDRNTPIGRSLLRALRYHSRGQWTFRSIEYQQLRRLLLELQIVERGDPLILSEVRKRLRRQPLMSQYIGLREEIAVAAYLIDHSIPFRKGDSPDFTIEVGGHELYMECASTHVQTTQLSDLYLKVARAIGGKGRKPYASRRGMISMDVTNIHFHMSSRGTPVSRERLQETAKRAIDQTHWGAIVLTAGVFNEDTNQYVVGYYRADADAIDPALHAFLEALHG